MARKILIVEDDPVSRQVLHRFLTQNQFQCTLAGDAAAALTETRKEKPDLIILDLGLPAGGGFTFLERRKMFPALAVIPVIVLSGQDRATHEERARNLGASVYIQKPAKNEDVLEQVRQILGA
jgi:DNA-binding response OmpR family regulator